MYVVTNEGTNKGTYDGMNEDISIFHIPSYLYFIMYEGSLDFNQVVYT